MAWGKAQEPASLFALAKMFPDRMAIEVCHVRCATAVCCRGEGGLAVIQRVRIPVQVGLCLCEGDDLPPSWGFQPGSLPPLGASPDALITRAVVEDAGVDGATPQGAGSLSAFMDLCCQLYSLAAAWLCLDAGANQLALLPAAGLANLHLDVVEVKNTCPFGMVSSR
jgi:hypothetical protein